MMNELLRKMCRVARQCGEIMLSADERLMAVRQKSGRRDLVTAFDMKIQAFAAEELAAAFPGARFICEEGDSAAPESGALVFVIDPIDGTTNFIHRCGHSCTSIACVRDGEPVAAAICNPYRGELFTAEKGGGAFLNGKPIRVSENRLADSLVLFGTSPYHAELADETFRRARSIFDRCQNVRRSGSAALDLCDAACGRAGLFFESELSLWDYAAGALIVEEAGGVCLALDGGRLPFSGPGKSSCIAGSADIVRESGLVGAAE